MGRAHSTQVELEATKKLSGAELENLSADGSVILQRIRYYLHVFQDTDSC